MGHQLTMATSVTLWLRAYHYGEPHATMATRVPLWQTAFHYGEPRSTLATREPLQRAACHYSEPRVTMANRVPLWRTECHYGAPSATMANRVPLWRTACHYGGSPCSQPKRRSKHSWQYGLSLCSLKVPLFSCFRQKLQQKSFLALVRVNRTIVTIDLDTSRVIQVCK